MLDFNDDQVVADANRNKSLAQNGLAIEVLQQIFTHLPGGAARSRDEFPACLIPLHVCRSWRSAVLSHAELWDPVPVNNPVLTALALELLEQWGALGLNVAIYPGVFVDRAAMFKALSEPSSMRRLVCSSTPEANGAIYEATNLKSLSIWQDQSPYLPTYTRDNPHSRAGAFGKAQMLQELEELRLHGEIMSFSADLLANMPMLTVLEISLSDRRQWPILSDLHEALRLLPLLKSLTLRDGVLPTGYSPDPGIPESDGDIVGLIDLKQLCLEASATVLFRMLQHLYIPQCTRLALTVVIDSRPRHQEENEAQESWDLDENLPNQIIAMFGTRLPDEHPLEHLALHVLDEAKDGLRVNEFWEDPSHVAQFLDQFSSLRTLNLRFGLSGSGGFPESSAVLPLLTHLHISAPVGWTADAAELIDAPESVYRSYAFQLNDRVDEPSEAFLEDLRNMLSLPNTTASQNTARASYTRLDITPARDNPVACLRVVASGRIGDNAEHVPPIVDVTFENRFLPGPRVQRAPFTNYVQALSVLLSLLPLRALDTVYIADTITHNYDLKRYSDLIEPPSVLLNADVLRHLTRARCIEIAYNTAAVFPILEAATAFTRLEHIFLQSLEFNNELAEIKLLPRLNARAGAIPVHVSVADCAITDRDVHVLRMWAGKDNLTWDGRDTVDCKPSWGAGDSPWLAPDAREIRFWQPDVWENLLCRPGNED
ncbi:hypothetical protein PENSPDRAFT_748359 [Peniophora sp. CONT]|nr:hypothetical protein PENSPDRAFT_748359 [Peniophora sp. CONT]